MQRGVSSDTLCEDLAAKEFQHNEKILYFLLFSMIFLWLGLVCSSPPSGNQVDGLPLVASTGEDRMGPAPRSYKCVGGQPLIATCSKSVFRNELSS